MSSGLVAISRKIKDMESILKISEALQLISSTKLKNYRDMREKGRDYVEGIKFLFRSFYSSYEHDYKVSNAKFVYIGEGGEKLSLWVVIGTDLALCGRFNAQIIDYLVKNFPLDGFLVVFGKKLFNLLKGYPALKERIIEIYPSEIKSADLVESLEVVSKFVLKEYITRGCYHLNLVHHKVGRELRNFSILPFTKDYFGRARTGIRYDTHYHRFDNSESIIELFPAYFERTILVALIESKISEHSQRRELMNNAVKAAEEKLAEYKIVYQKMRQANITQEITEITSALKLNMGG
ncbi:ATP synthase gamma chain (ATP synthase F1 sector gamma subunit) [Mycoplasma suis KI3806]|uniref:ATP synthase gamma chain (ATP synthase F1 sector gamma subunit) n=1 Tax=Mycoplasma suis (strain KI_3806) TaxID=708248 RepID=F0V1K7_MYCS3|nr:F0F1 ATP synthase subunit gamma [Mycoplasma suis]CBZ40538.1 ATP synthase gamma chain (ATP synthase F1 sector gamma subunit) [Mycoplasma suis KI3806]